MTLEQKIERLKQIRKMAEINAEDLPDEQAVTVPTLYPEWKAGETVKEGDRRYYADDGKLYKCRQDHTTQADWTPDKTPAMWAVIDTENAGTIDNPYNASRGMDYIYGKYYLDPEDGKTYLCRREGAQDGEIINLQYLPHELIGNYFELAE